jgi:hypothetical protein
LFFCVDYKAKTKSQVNPIKRRCWYCVLLHTTSKITIKGNLLLLSIPNYSLTPTVSFISGLTNFRVCMVVWYYYYKY